jgi:RHS repeat-associated protein
MINYTYNAAGKVDNVHMEQDGVITNLSLNISYLPFGNEAIQTYGNGISVMRLYDQAYRPFIVGDPVFYFEYISAYDENGNIKNLMTLDDSIFMNSIFDYDEHKRLMSSDGFHGQFNYTYDKAGNKQTQVGNGIETAFTYSVNSNRLAELNSEATNMDENGNITSLRGMVFAYTADNRLKTTNTGAAYEYNGLGQRTIKHTVAPGVAGANTYSQSNSFIYGLNGELLAEIGPTGSVKKEYVYLNNQLLAMLDRIPSSNEPILNADLDNDGGISVEDFLVWYFNHQTDPAYEVTGDGIADSDDINAVINCALTQGGCIASSYSTEIYYVHNDHLGTPKMLTNSNGQPVWRSTATPFGKSSVDNDVDDDGLEIEFNLRQPGQYYDPESGLYYNYYRYYDPETGRYITSDPIGVLPGLSPTPNLPKSITNQYASKNTQGILMRGLNHAYAYVDNNPLGFIDPFGLLGGVRSNGSRSINSGSGSCSSKCWTSFIKGTGTTAIVGLGLGAASGVLFASSPGWGTAASASIHTGSNYFGVMGYLDVLTCLDSCEEDGDQCKP